MQAESARSFSASFWAILLMAMLFTLNFMVQTIMAPLMPMIEMDLGINHTRAGSMFLLFTLGICTGLLCSGFISSRWGHRRTVLCSIWGCALVLVLVACSPSSTYMSIMLVVMGLMAGPYMPSGLATIIGLVVPADKGKAVGLHQIGPSLAMTIAPSLSGAIMHWWSWRVVLFVVAGILFLAGLVFLRFGRGGRFPGQAPNFSMISDLIHLPAFWIILTSFILGVGGGIGTYSILPLYAVSERGLDAGTVNTILGVSRIPGFFLVLAAGWINDRLGERRSIMLALAGSGLTTLLLGVAPDSWLLTMMFLQCSVSVFFFVPGVAALARIGPPNVSNLATSLVLPMGFLVGNGAIPALIGYLGETRTFGLGIAIVGGVIMVGTVVAAYLKLPREY